MNARVQGREFAPGKSNLIHDTFGVMPGKQTLTMALQREMGDGIDLPPSSGGLVDKETAEPGAVAAASTAPAGAHAEAGGGPAGPGAEAGEALGEEASGSDGVSLDSGGGDDVADVGDIADESEHAGGESRPGHGEQVSNAPSTAASAHDELRDQLGGGSGGGGTPSGTVGGSGGGGTPSGTVGAATFSTIDYPTTPAGVGHRIPPRKNVGVHVTVTGLAPRTRAVLSFDGAPAGGNGTIDGRVTKAVSRSGRVTIRGTAQTAPGSAGRLSLWPTSGRLRSAAATRSRSARSRRGYRSASAASSPAPIAASR